MDPVSPDLETDPSDAPHHGPSGHPLFPRAEQETGADMRRIDLIHVERVKDDGTWEACPRVFKAHELQSWKDVVDLFGGGIYRARAQCKKTHQWQGMTERKEFNGPAPRPFCDEPPRPKAAPAPPPAPPQAPSFGQPVAPPGWSPPPGYAPPGWSPPPGWTPSQLPAAQSPNEPPVWLALVLKAMDRPPPPAASGEALFAVLFKAQSERDAVMLKAQTERDALLFKLLADRSTAPAGVAASPLEIFRELKPLLANNSAPGQLMQGIEIAKSLMQQGAPAAPQEDFATTLSTLMRTLSPNGIPGLTAPTAPPPPAAPAPAPAPPHESAPTMTMDDLMRYAARDRNLAQRFIDELRRNVPSNDTRSAPAAAPLDVPISAPVPPPAAVPTAAQGTPAPSAPPAPAAPITGATAPSMPSAPPTAEPDDEPSLLDGLPFLSSPEVQAAMKAAGEDGRRRILMQFAGAMVRGEDGADGADTGQGRTAG